MTVFVIGETYVGPGNDCSPFFFRMVVTSRTANSITFAHAEGDARSEIRLDHNGEEYITYKRGVKLRSKEVHSMAKDYRVTDYRTVRPEHPHILAALARAAAKFEAEGEFVVTGIKATPRQQRSLTLEAVLASQQGEVTRTVMTGRQEGGRSNIQSLGEDLQDVYYWASLGQPEGTVLTFMVKEKAFTLSQTDVRSYRTTMVVKPALISIVEGFSGVLT